MNDNAQAREQARQDGTDIRELRACVGFNRYWMRRVRQRHATAERAFKYDPPEKCSPDQREALRQQMLAYEDLLGMLDRDEKVAFAAVE